jgi:hypothetical protein
MSELPACSSAMQALLAKLVKGKSGHPIDGAVALAMALVTLTAKKKPSLVVFA